MTLSSSQPDLNLVNAPSPSLDPASGISCPLTSKSSQTLVFKYCICVWSGIKPLSQQQWPCQAVNQTQTWWTRLLRRWTPRLESAAHRPQSHHRHSCFRCQLKRLYFCGHTISAHSHCSGPPVNCRWQHRLCVIVLHCTIFIFCVIWHNKNNVLIIFGEACT